MWRLIGHEPAVVYLQRSLSVGRLSHAYLLTGPRHVGKRTLALQIAQALNCVSPEASDRPCQQCRPCQRIAAGHHADVRFISRMAQEASASGRRSRDITIGQVQAIQREAALEPFEGRCRVYIFLDSEHLNREAANCLLKTLEEPPSKVVIILTSAEPESLLPTVMSRCQRLELRPLAPRVIVQSLKDTWSVPEERAELLARLSEGRIGWAIETLKDEQVLLRRLAEAEELLGLLKADRRIRLAYAAKLAELYQEGGVSNRELLAPLQRVWRDLLLLSTGSLQSITYQNLRDVFAEHALCYTPYQIAHYLRLIQETALNLERNVNPRLALDVLMLNIPSVATELGKEKLRPAAAAERV